MTASFEEKQRLMSMTEIQRCVTMPEANVGMDYTACEHAYTPVHK